MIKIKEPRYRDRTVLLAEHRLFVGEDVDFLIVSGAYKGKYHVAWEDIDGAKQEQMKTRNGAYIPMRAVPIAKLKRIGDVDEE